MPHEQSHRGQAGSPLNACNASRTVANEARSPLCVAGSVMRHRKTPRRSPFVPEISVETGRLERARLDMSTELSVGPKRSSKDSCPRCGKSVEMSWWTLLPSRDNNRILTCKACGGHFDLA